MARLQQTLLLIFRLRSSICPSPAVCCATPYPRCCTLPTQSSSSVCRCRSLLAGKPQLCGLGLVSLVGWLLVLARYFPKCQIVELFVSSLIGKINELNLIALKHIIYCLFRLSVWPMGVPSSFNPSAHLEMAHSSIGWNNTGVFAIGCFTIKYYC